jgi:flagellar protein FlaI
VRDFADYEKLTPIMRDENIEDISCNSPEVPVFLYHKVHRDVITNVMYSQDELDEFVASLAQSSGKHISIAEPDLQGRLPDGSRMQLTYSDEISDEGSNFTIRKFQEEPFTPIDLIEFNTFSLSQMAYLWLAIQNEKSLIFAGGTASGKTTSMNAISLFIPPRAKIVSIEDTREITLRHSNWIKSVTRDSFGGGGTGEVDMYDLLRDALRQRPEYIIVGEIRGEEARTLFQAMSTGHTTYSTMHADDVGAAVRRLENEPINLPRQMLSSLDILSVQIRMIDDGDVMRRCKEMVEIVDIDSDTNEIKSKTTFEYNPDKDVVSYKGDSDILEEIKNINSWSQSELEDELERRKTVLRYLKEEVETRDYEIISSVLRTYMQDKDLIMEQIETGDLLKGK